MSENQCLHRRAQTSPVELQRGYVTIDGAAEYASVSTRTIKRWIKAGLPRYQGCSRGRVLLKPSDIDLYLTRQQAPQIDLDMMVDEDLAGFRVDARLHGTDQGAPGGAKVAKRGRSME